MIKNEDLKNQRFGKLTAKEQVDAYKWKCICDCGREKMVRVYDLRSGNTQSCGCARYMTPLNLTGRQIGRLTVLEFDKTITRPCKSKRRDFKYIHYWLCQCECGNVKSIPHRCLTKRNATQSCGCLHKELLIQRSTKPNAGFNRVYNNYISRCKSYHIIFELSVDEFFDLTQQNCFYCGIEPSQIKPAWSQNIQPFIYNGVDRVDSNKGYVKDNCVSCCSRCNYAKGDMTLENYKIWLQTTYRHLFG